LHDRLQKVDGKKRGERRQDRISGVECEGSSLDERWP
jgi:hypothetical protein